MSGCIEAFRSLKMGGALALGRSILVAALVAGCSSVPDAINPVEWYKGATDLVTGRDRPEVASPRPARGEFPDVNQTPDVERKAVPKGLTGDRGNAKYADPVRREPTPTKPLARRTPAPVEPQVAAAAPQPAPTTTAAVPPPPAVQTQPLPAPAQIAQAEPAKAPPAQGKGGYVPSLDSRMPTARDIGPSAPPSVAPGGPPGRPDIPETVPVPTRRGGVQDFFQKRLAESRPTAPASPAAVAMPSDSGRHLTLASDETAPVLRPPRGMRSHGARGVVAPPVPASTFQVATVAFSGGAQLSASDRQAIKEVARLYRQTGGTIRIVGHAPSAFESANPVARMMSGVDASMARANAVAKALTQAGVPSSKLFVGADPTPVSLADAGSGADVFLDY
jgi:outer membrane protein OmpA-like peptidoglycan-associated protein